MAKILSTGAARVAVTLLTLVEHLQVMSYGNRMLAITKYRWNSQAKEIFAHLAKLALRFTGDGFLYVYVLSLICSLGPLVLYILLLPHVHNWNRKSGFASWCILAIDQLVFGVGFVPMISALSDVQYCNDDGMLMDYTHVECWKTTQLNMMVFAFFAASAAVAMAAIVCPILKSERRGVETRWVDEAYFPGLFKLLEVGIINLFAAVHHAYLGITACGALIIYLAVFQCYRDVFIASAKMGVLWGQLWVFACAQAVTEDSDLGSSLLIGWAPMVVLGYVFMLLLTFLLRRRSTPKLSLEK